jgi:hypothetical protein
MREGIGLARPGAGDDEQGTGVGTGVGRQAVLYGLALFRVP